jgi:hypothetical protein
MTPSKKTSYDEWRNSKSNTERRTNAGRSSTGLWYQTDCGNVTCPTTKGKDVEPLMTNLRLKLRQLLKENEELRQQIQQQEQTVARTYPPYRI